MAKLTASFLLTFALADLEEDLKHIAEASAAYDNLLSALSADLDKLKASVDSEVEAAKGPEVPQLNGGGDVDMTTQHEKLVEERENRGKLVSEKRGREIESASAAIGVVWVMYMRHARRATVSHAHVRHTMISSSLAGHQSCSRHLWQGAQVPAYHMARI